MKSLQKASSACATAVAFIAKPFARMIQPMLRPVAQRRYGDGGSGSASPAAGHP